jgi:hypothetical protein
MPRNRKLSHVLDQDPRPVAKKTKRTRAKVQCHCDKCKGKSVDPRIKERHDNEVSSQISAMDTSQEVSSQISAMVIRQEVYEDIDTDESSHSVLSSQNETSMQDIEQPVDVEEYDNNDYNFLPRERISRYIKLSANFDINDFERSESELNTDNDSDDSDDSVNNEPHEIFEDYSCPPLESFQVKSITHPIHNNQFL